MSKSEILAELPKLTPAERYEIRQRLVEPDGGWFDEDDLLTVEQKSLLEARLNELDQHPEESSPWDKARKQIETRFIK